MLWKLLIMIGYCDQLLILDRSKTEGKMTSIYFINKTNLLGLIHKQIPLSCIQWSLYFVDEDDDLKKQKDKNQLYSFTKEMSSSFLPSFILHCVHR